MVVGLDVLAYDKVGQKTLGHAVLNSAVVVFRSTIILKYDEWQYFTQMLSFNSSFD